ncbi:uncharacterized protein LOC132393194 isoform X2 [Hypanus sabinus]|uniref:uncharacterized protein LOC132393194 isoform X2 n=1 Tax=Hypanus sabinus TaxID=79690 RepID=UPI0028C3B13F|nr:uncharacterized protein LOC132393194 isoform X2 [Hypanus sabinus]
MDKFESFYILKRNVTYERYKFFTFTQRAGETIDQYVTELRHQSKTCKFGELIDSLINDRIVCGILDNGLRERLLRGQDLDMEKALMLCKASEIVALQAKELFIENCKVDTVRKCKHIRKNNKTTTKTTESKTSSERKKLCDCLWTAALTKTGSGVWKNWQQLCFINCAFHIEPQTWNPNNPCHGPLKSLTWRYMLTTVLCGNGTRSQDFMTGRYSARQGGGLRASLTFGGPRFYGIGDGGDWRYQDDTDLPKAVKIHILKQEEVKNVCKYPPPADLHRL